MPSQFRNRGDRLVFSNGVVVLAALAAVLVYLFDADLTRLIQLYVVGVFTAFTLSQPGMVRRWFRVRGQDWVRSAVINGVGAVTTGVVLVIVTMTKFTHGAWIRDRDDADHRPVLPGRASSLRAGRPRPARAAAERRGRLDNTFLVLVDVSAPRCGMRPGTSSRRGPRPWSRCSWCTPRTSAPRRTRVAPGCTEARELQPLRGGGEHPARAIKRYIRAMPREPGDFVTVVIPEALVSYSWFQFLGRRCLLLKSPIAVRTGRRRHGRPVDA